LDALDKHRNVLIDASLRTTSGYLQYFKELRASYPILKIAIVCVESNVFTILERAKQRALVTGRLVPEKFIINSLKEIVHSMNTLVPHIDFYAKIVNEDNSDPMLTHCELHFRDEHLQTSQETQQDEDTAMEGNADVGPPLDSSPNESSGNRKKMGRKKVQDDIKTEWVLRQKDLSLEMMSALSSSTLTKPSSSALDTTGLLDPLPIATHTLTTIKRKKGQEFVKSGNGGGNSESNGVANRVRSTSGNVDDFEIDNNHESNRKPSISLATRILNRKDDFGTSPSISNNSRKKIKSNAKSSSSQLTATEIEEGILEKKVKEVFDWRPHFKEVWQLRCELSSYYQDRLRRLTAMKRQNQHQQHSQFHLHDANNGSNGSMAVIARDSEKDRMKDQLANDRTHQVDGEDHQAAANIAFSDRGHVVDPASSGWFCLPFFFKASPSASSNTGTTAVNTTSNAVAVPLVSSPYAKINPELATTSTEETVKLTSE
jgi:hypothetical protein